MCIFMLLRMVVSPSKMWRRENSVYLLLFTDSNKRRGDNPSIEAQFRGISHHIDWWIVTDVSKGPSAFIFRIKQSMDVISVQLVENFSAFTEPAGSLPSVKVAGTGPHPEPGSSLRHSHTLFKINFITILRLPSTHLFSEVDSSFRFPV